MVSDVVIGVAKAIGLPPEDYDMYATCGFVSFIVQPMLAVPLLSRSCTL
jgi:hypothetical protein